MPARGQGMVCFSVRMTTKSGCEMWSDSGISMRALSRVPKPANRHQGLTARERQQFCEEHGSTEPDFHSQGSDERSQSCRFHLIPLPKLCLAQLHRPTRSSIRFTGVGDHHDHHRCRKWHFANLLTHEAHSSAGADRRGCARRSFVTSPAVGSRIDR